jgi:hypothetical protein
VRVCVRESERETPPTKLLASSFLHVLVGGGGGNLITGRFLFFCKWKDQRACQTARNRMIVSWLSMNRTDGVESSNGVRVGVSVSVSVGVIVSVTLRGIWDGEC